MACCFFGRLSKAEPVSVSPQYRIIKPAYPPMSHYTTKIACIRSILVKGVRPAINVASHAPSTRSSVKSVQSCYMSPLVKEIRGDLESVRGHLVNIEYEHQMAQIES